MASRDDVRQALIQRVSRKVSGHGVARRSIEGAVDRVLAALPAGALSRAGAPSTTAALPARVAVLSATSAPDLPSRTRQALERAGVAVGGMGSATAGRHTVVTLRTTGASASDLERVAAGLGAAITLLDETSTRQMTA